MIDPGMLITVGIIFIVSGFLAFALGSLLQPQDNRAPEEKDTAIEEKKVKGGGVILIGPIPIIFGTDKRYAVIVILLAIILMLLAVILSRS